MTEYELVAEPPLAGTNISVGALRLSAPGDLSIVSIAMPLEEESAAEKALKSAFKTTWPEHGTSALTDDGLRLVRTGPDQALLLLPETRLSPDAYVTDLLSGKVYTTDQSDVWAALMLEGEAALEALERICPIDLGDEAFPVGSAARTVMEHLGVLIIRTDQNAFLLLSASSSASSFLHMLETSMRNVT